MWLLLACWSPAETPAPELAPLEVLSDVDPAEGAPDAPEGEEPDAEAEPEGAPGEAPEPEPPEATPFDEYVAYTTASPVSIVDDYGKPLVIIQKVGTPVEVQAEDDIRRRVFCASCSPPTEGWVQRVVVTDRGAKPPKTATVLPPGSPVPGAPPAPVAAPTEG